MSVVALCAVLALVSAPWMLALRPRIGGIAAVAGVTLAVPALILALMFVAHALGLDLAVASIALVVVAAVAGWIWWWRSRGSRAAALSVPVRAVWPAGIGAGIALATFALAHVVPGASRIAWAMLGDSASQLVEARLMTAAGGIAPPPLNNPVPLTPALVAAVAAPSRPASGAADVLRHDLSAYATTWAVLIVVSCLVAGVVAHAVVAQSDHMRGAAGKFAVGLTSLLPLGWFWTGYPVKFGFINAHVAYVILLAAIAAYIAWIRRPWIGIGFQALAAVLLLLTWSPLAIVPAGLALVHGVAGLRSWGTLPRAARIGVLALASVAVALGLVLGVPMLLEARGSLNIAGGLAPFPKPMLPLAVAVLVTIVCISPSRWSKANWGLLSVGASSLAGLAVVLVLSGQVTGPWSYYPHKYAWIATAVVLTLAVPLAFGAAAAFPSRLLRWGLYAGVSLAVAVSLGLGSWWAPGHAGLLRNNLPVLILVEDDLPDSGQSPSAVPEAVIGLVDEERLTIPWRSSLANDYRAAFWIIQLERERAILEGDGAAADALWVLANFHEEPADVCRLAEIVSRGVTVETNDASARDAFAAACDDLDIDIVAAEN
jgi:hypothetical protein